MDQYVAAAPPMFATTYGFSQENLMDHQYAAPPMLATTYGFSQENLMDHQYVAPPMLLPTLRFEPSDLTLMCYLFSKATGKSTLHMDQAYVQEYDLYGEQEPWQIWEFFGGNNLEPGDDLYFFTRLKKKSSNGGRINRTVGTGTWKGETSGKPIIYSPFSPTKPLGFKKTLRYEDGVPQQEGHWIMHEYSLEPSLVSNNDYVVVRLRKNDREEKRAAKRIRL